MFLRPGNAGLRFWASHRHEARLGLYMLAFMLVWAQAADLDALVRGFFDGVAEAS